MTQAATAPAGVGSLGFRKGADATTVLTAYVLLLWFVPSAMVVPALGSAGSPASLLGVACAFWWAWSHIQRTRSTGVGLQPVRMAMLVWMLIMLVVYAHAMSRPMPSDEVSVADNGVLRLVGVAGVLLLANDGIPTYARFHLLLRRLAMAAGVVAVLGLIQYLTRQLWVDRLTIPGLTASALSGELGGRSGFVRPSGTSTSPIEYGVVLALTLPVVIALATSKHRHRMLFRILLIPMIASIYFSVSRSAYLCALVGVAVLAVSWSRRQRAVALLVLVAATIGMYLSVPGLLGTIVGLFSGAGEDPSVASRTGSYQVAGAFIGNSPALGRGFGTFLPRYWILDNGYLGLLIEGGIVGFIGLVALIVVGLLASRQASTWCSDSDEQQIARAIAASIVAAAAGMAFFDTFAFPQSAGGMFLMLGLAGAMRRLKKPGTAG